MSAGACAKAAQSEMSCSLTALHMALRISNSYESRVSQEGRAQTAPAPSRASRFHPSSPRRDSA
eukprot:6523948-Lingulodinium_polyedra.AAC.1